MGDAKIVQINVSDGGVPKLPVPRVAVRASGLEGDRQRDLRYHGGPDRAVSIFSAEVIERLRAEGHPIVSGGAGENLTIAGLDWAALGPGARLSFAGGVVLQITTFAPPCRNLAEIFRDGDFSRISPKKHPTEARLYARVLAEGTLEVGEAVVATAAVGA